MITSRFCKSCGSKNAFDDSNEKFFCSFCGAVNLVDPQSSITDGGNASFASPEQSDEGTKPDIKTASGFVPLSAKPNTINSDTNKTASENMLEKEDAEEIASETHVQVNEPSETKAEKKKSKKIAKVIAISISVLIGVCIIVGAILFFIKRIPSEYYGTYVRYWFIDGNETKTTYKITALSVEYTSERIVDGKEETYTETCKYTKKGDDLIICDNNGTPEFYLIIDDDCLYVETSKDISLSKKYGSFYWNEKSDKADIYEIERRADGFEDLIESTMNTWAREEVYTIHDREIKNSDFYILRSDEETDETDLNTYIIKYKAAGGDLSLYYDKNTKELEWVYFSGFVDFSSYSRSKPDYMSLDDYYDSQALLISLMYILGNNENIKLNTDENSNDYKLDYPYRLDTEIDAFTVFASLEIDPEYDDRYTSSLDNEKYKVSYSNWISLRDTVLVSYSVSKRNK